MAEAKTAISPSRVRDAKLSFQAGLKAGRSSRGNSEISLQRGVVNCLKGSANPTRIQQIGLRQARTDDGVVSNTAKLALVPRILADVKRTGAGRNRGRGFWHYRCAHPMYQGVRQNVRKQHQQ